MFRLIPSNTKCVFNVKKNMPNYWQKKTGKDEDLICYIFFFDDDFIASCEEQKQLRTYGCRLYSMRQILSSL